MKVADRCYAVTGLGYIPPWCVNAGFVAGNDITLIIDTGANSMAAATLHGYATAVNPGNLVRVLNCEKHLDHIGGNSFFADLGVEIWGHSGIQRTEAEFREQLAEFNAAIPDPARRADHEEAVFFAGTRLALPTRHIERDLMLDLGNCSVEILLTPGHTETNLSVWVPEQRVLFAADCLVNGYRPNTSSASPAEWRNSLHRLRKLNPIAVVPGHGCVAQGSAVEKLFQSMEAALA